MREITDLLSITQGNNVIKLVIFLYYEIFLFLSLTGDFLVL